MKFSTLVLAAVVGSVSGFAPSQTSRVNGPLTAATLESVEAEAATSAVSSSAVESETSVVNGAVVIDTPIKAGMADSIMTKSSQIKTSRIQPGRYDEKENSVALPFLKRPAALDGTHAGDFGFDPLGFTESFDLYSLQEAEIRHARLAMLAVVGWPLSELVAPEWMLQNGCAPSVLNGFNPLSFIATVGAFAAFGLFEYKTCLRATYNTELGKLHKQDMADVWKYGVPGDYNFDPLNLYNSIGDDAYARKGLREVEISHGRSAMLGITGFAMWEALTGHPIVENSMFFHPNALLPALFLSYVAFGQFYEVEDSDMYLRFKMSSEGKARMENLKIQLGINGAPNDSEDRTQQVLSTLGDIVEKLVEFGKELPAKYEQINSAYYDNVVKGGKNE